MVLAIPVQDDPTEPCQSKDHDIPELESPDCRALSALVPTTVGPPSHLTVEWDEGIITPAHRDVSLGKGKTCTSSPCRQRNPPPLSQPHTHICTETSTHPTFARAIKRSEKSGMPRAALGKLSHRATALSHLGEGGPAGVQRRLLVAYSQKMEHTTTSGL
jgi:hypothetical protein